MKVSVSQYSGINNLANGSYVNTISHNLNATPVYILVTLSDGTVFNSLPWKPDPNNPLNNILLSWGTDAGSNLPVIIIATAPQTGSSSSCCKKCGC